jgi:hypothetical protein
LTESKSPERASYDGTNNGRDVYFEANDTAPVLVMCFVDVDRAEEIEATG